MYVALACHGLWPGLHCAQGSSMGFGPKCSWLSPVSSKQCLPAEVTCFCACRSLTIVQQNQIKKARKLQEDAKAEQERLVSGVHATEHTFLV